MVSMKKRIEELKGSLFGPGIRRQLVLGYMTTIGLAAVGIQMGQLIAYYTVERPAQQRFYAVYQYGGHLSELQRSFLKAKGLIANYIQHPELLEDYDRYLLLGARQVQHLLDDFVLEKTAHGSLASLDETKSREFLEVCRTAGSDYERAIKVAIQSPSSGNGNTLGRNQSQTRLLDFVGGEESIQLETCSLKLESLISYMQEQVLRASNSLESADQLQQRITQLTLIATLVVAMLLALYHSWSITRPLMAVSQVAKQVSSEENFDLQVPVRSQDEIGQVGQSLNDLIRRVKDLMQLQLQRSEELREKNNQLQNTIQALHQTQSQLVQAEKMSSLGQMVAGIAHEINNPISFIHGNIKPLEAYFQDLSHLIDLYQSEYPQPGMAIQEHQEDIDLDFVLKDVALLLESMKIGTVRVRDIVISLRNYSRLDEATVKDVDIHEGLESTLLILNHRVERDIEVIKEYGSLPKVRCSPSQLNQVYTNLITNAIDALEGRLVKQLILQTRVLPSMQIEIIIRDTGKGISPQNQAKIFDPFFTTKPVGKGTGLGLGICIKIIQQHQGTIEIQSVVGEGTAFVITLPAESGLF